MALFKILCLLALAVTASAVECGKLSCLNGAQCSADGLSCDCTTAPHTSGNLCQSCFPNYSPLDDCRTVIDPCQTCPTKNAADCYDTPNLCPLYGTCTSPMAGQYKCKCSKGFSGASAPNATHPAGVCMDINECGMKKTPCPTWSTCTNTNGWYNCKCVAGRRPLYDSTGMKLRFCVK